MKVWTEDTMEPELAGDKQDTIEDDDKDDNGEMEAAGKTDAVSAARSCNKAIWDKLKEEWQTTRHDARGWMNSETGKIALVNCLPGNCRLLYQCGEKESCQNEYW